VWWKEKVEAGGIEESSGAGSTGATKNSSALATVVATLKERKGDSAEKVVTIRGNCVGLDT